jgi:Na(+)-translocating NADH:ubiquinone oxidoreductase F subunit
MPAPVDQPDIPAGMGSSYMCSLKDGEKITLSGPFGHFAAKDSDREMILIGGGAGMAPLRAIIRDQLLYKKSSRKISFWYGVRNKEDIFYQEEFETLVNNHKNMMFQIGLSEPKDTDNWDGPTGFIHKITMEHYLSDHPDLSNSEFYLCGPPAMLAATRAMLHDLGIPEDNISFDDFGI